MDAIVEQQPQQQQLLLLLLLLHYLDFSLLSTFSTTGNFTCLSHSNHRHVYIVV